MSDQMMKILTR